MAVEAPNSYKDPFWSDLAGRVEAKLDLPKGLLVGVVTRGERTNADQTSEAGAKTPFQIIPATRKAAIDKWGIDPYLSPENAAEVAGKLLRESLDRNQNDPKLAVAEYIGGTDRKNWGPTTRAYVQRVVGSQPSAQAQPVADQAPNTAIDLPSVDPAQGGQSTFDRVSAAMKPAGSAIANVYAAYKDGQMSPEQAQAFEADVNAGKVMLPRGAQLNAVAAAAPGPESAEANIVKAFNGRLMTPEQQAALLKDVQSGAFKVPAGLSLNIPGTTAGSGIPDTGPGLSGPVAVAPKPTLGEVAVGTGEAGLTALTGTVGGTVGMVGGTLEGLAQQILNGQFGTPEAADAVERAAAAGAQSLTYAPRTQSGQDQAEALGGAMQQIIPVAPLTGMAAGLSRAGAPLRMAGVDAAQAARGAVSERIAPIAQAVGERAGAAMQAVRDRLPGAAPAETAPTPGTLGSAGAAGTDMAAQRRALAADLPVPIKLTKGQAERSFEQQRFEQEAAKDPGTGAPLRERYAQQNEDILKNFDAWMDQTGAEAPSLRAVGTAVDKALVEQAKNDKTAFRMVYKEAEKAGELAEPVELSKVIDHLNESAPDAATAPLLDVARRRAIQLGLAVEGADGNLVAQPVTLKAAETFRQAINRATDYEATNVRQSAIIKGLVDEGTEGAGGNLYKRARDMRSRYAANYENRANVSKLLEKKRGTTDRQVALEDVFDHTVLRSTLDDVRNVRRVLQRGGEEGAQAWRELQGSTVNWIKSEATKGVATDIRGNQIVSPAALNKALRTLDADGKLDFIFGKKGAQQLRDINDLSKAVFTAPPGSVNTSNTASVLLAALTEAGISGSITGLPIPVLSGLRLVANTMKERRIARRISEALGDAERAKNAAKPAVTRAPTKTLH
jgi:hypothetical protein